LRSLLVVVGAAQTWSRLSPRARITVRSCVDSVLGSGGFAAGQFCFGVGEVAERGLPGGFQAAGDEPVVRVDGPVSALGLGGGVADAFDLASPLAQCCVMAGFECFGGGQAGLQGGRGERGEDGVHDGGFHREAADVDVVSTAAVDH
jgi:hypothetical protein